MSIKYSFLIGFAALVLLNQTALAFTSEPAAKDSHGVQLADPDEQFDNTDSQKSGASVMNFGDGVQFSISNGQQGQSTGSATPADSAQTGDQMFDPAWRSPYRR